MARLPLPRSRALSGRWHKWSTKRGFTRYLQSIIARLPTSTLTAPEFLGHLTENGRIIGFLLEKVDGEAACIDDLTKCESLVRRMHGLRFIHAT